jgi:hypothetical protein
MLGDVTDVSCADGAAPGPAYVSNIWFCERCGMSALLKAIIRDVVR